MWGRRGRRKHTALLPEPWAYDQDAGWIRYFPDAEAPTHRVEVVGPGPDRHWVFTVYEYSDSTPEAVSGGSRSSFDAAKAASVGHVARLQKLDGETSEQRDSVGDLMVKLESLQQRRLRVAEIAVRVAKAELRQLDVFNTPDVVLERAQLAVERAKLEAETIKAESPEISYFTVQNPEAAIAELRKHSEEEADPRGRAKANWRRFGGR